MIGIQLGSIALLVTTLIFAGKSISKAHHWKGQHLYEVAGEVTMFGIIGAIISWCASFHGDNSLYAGLSTLLFTVFFWPLFGLKWFGEWPGTTWADRNRANPVPGFVTFGISMTLLGLGAFFACLNSAFAANALIVGLTIGGVAFCVMFLLGLFAEGFLVRE